jgi:hypothetical protein
MSGVSSFCVLEHLASRQVIDYDYSGPKARFETLDPRRGFLILVDGQSPTHGSRSLIMAARCRAAR